MDRSENMRRIHSRDTMPEMTVRRFLHAAGLRYRLHDRGLPGKPDIVFPSRRVAVFVHGCFWHRHSGCKIARLPKSRVDYWKPKLAKNAERDARQRRRLNRLGWRVFVIWECQTNDPARLGALVDKIRRVPAERDARSLF